MRKAVKITEKSIEVIAEECLIGETTYVTKADLAIEWWGRYIVYAPVENDDPWWEISTEKDFRSRYVFNAEEDPEHFVEVLRLKQH